MTNTPNYNLLLAEGTDLVNYLTQTNPNFSNLDTIIKGISDLTVTPATEVTTGTAHAISRTLPDATVIKFTATSNWQTGDTMTLDGTPVTPLKTDGTTLKTGDYIIGSAVLMIQDGTRLTVLVASSPDAGDINYTNDGTHTWLTANKVEGAINEAATEIDTINSNLTWRLLSATISNDQNNPTVVDVSGCQEFFVYCKPYYSGFANSYIKLMGNKWLAVGENSTESANIYFGFSGNTLSIYGSFTRNGSQVTPLTAELYGR